MSSDLFMLENPFFSDPFPTFADPHSFQIPQENLNLNIINNNNDNNNNCHDSYQENTFLSSSPPESQLEKTDYSVKTEECQLNSSSFNGFDGAYEAAVRLMQRSFSSNSFDNRHDLSFQPSFDCVLEPQPPETRFSEMRRVCSAGDLQNVRTSMETRNVLCSTEKPFTQEPNFRVGRYSAEERKGRIDRYRAKRTQRNFNKTIKYACRKTLADNRPRVRGRFARNEEIGEIPKASMSYGYEEEEDYLWTNELHIDGAKFFNISGSTQYRDCSYC